MKKSGFNSDSPLPASNEDLDAPFTPAGRSRKLWRRLRNCCLFCCQGSAQPTQHHHHGSDRNMQLKYSRKLNNTAINGGATKSKKGMAKRKGSWGEVQEYFENGNMYQTGKEVGDQVVMLKTNSIGKQESRSVNGASSAVPNTATVNPMESSTSSAKDQTTTLRAVFGSDLDEVVKKYQILSGFKEGKYGGAILVRRKRDGMPVGLFIFLVLVNIKFSVLISSK